jgi:hypothetical protein
MFFKNPTPEYKEDSPVDIKQFLELGEYDQDDKAIIAYDDLVDFRDSLLSLQATQIREKTVEECFGAFKKELTDKDCRDDVQAILYELNEFIADNFAIMLKNK